MSRTAESTSDTKTQILSLARHYLQSRGYNAFSFQDLADELQIRKSSVHHHFRSKEELGLALLESYQSGFRSWDERISTDVSAEAKLDKYFELFRKLLADGSRICPGGILSADLNTLPPSMKRGLEALQNQHRAWLEQTINEGRESGVFTTDSPVKAQVLLIASAIQGALQIARVHSSPDVFSSVVSQLRKALRKETL